MRSVFYNSGRSSGDGLHVAGARLEMRAPEAAIAQVPARLQVAIIDACRTSRGRAKGLTEAAPFALSVARPKGPAGTLWMKSSRDGEDAQESDQLGGGVF